MGDFLSCRGEGWGGLTLLTPPLPGKVGVELDSESQQAASGGPQAAAEPDCARALSAVLGGPESRGVLRKMSDLLELMVKRMDTLARLENGSELHRAAGDGHFAVDRSGVHGGGGAPGVGRGDQVGGAPGCSLKMHSQSWRGTIGQPPFF